MNCLKGQQSVAKRTKKKKKPLPFNCKISIESLKNTHHNHTYHLQYPHKFTHLFTQFEKKKTDANTDADTDAYTDTQTQHIVIKLSQKKKKKDETDRV